jgi:hypothetical protein
MIERGEHLRLAREACKAILIERELGGQHFERDVTRELRITRAIHLAHPACADRGEDFVRPEARASNQRHGLINNQQSPITNESTIKDREINNVLSGSLLQLFEPVDHHLELPSGWPHSRRVGRGDHGHEVLAIGHNVGVASSTRTATCIHVERQADFI